MPGGKSMSCCLSVWTRKHRCVVCAPLFYESCPNYNKGSPSFFNPDPSLGYFLHSECSASRRGDTDIEFIVTVPVDKMAAVTNSQTSLNTSSFVSNIEV